MDREEKEEWGEALVGWGVEEVVEERGLEEGGGAWEAMGDWGGDSLRWELGEERALEERGKEERAWEERGKEERGKEGRG